MLNLVENIWARGAANAKNFRKNELKCFEKIKMAVWGGHGDKGWTLEEQEKVDSERRPDTTSDGPFIIINIIIEL